MQELQLCTPAAQPGQGGVVSAARRTSTAFWHFNFKININNIKNNKNINKIKIQNRNNI